MDFQTTSPLALLQDLLASELGDVEFEFRKADAPDGFHFLDVYYEDLEVSIEWKHGNKFGLSYFRDIDDLYSSPDEYFNSLKALYHRIVSLLLENSAIMADIQYEQQKELSLWLDAIAEDIKKGKCRDNILYHLQKHTGEPIGIGEPCENMREWMASLINLVEIAKRTYEIEPTVSEQLSRLQIKFDKEGVENGYTPNPKYND